jgi:hypothetical protein
MHPKLKASLVEVIDNWSSECSDQKEWPSVHWGDRTSLCIVAAVEAVIDAMEDSQECKERESV